MNKFFKGVGKAVLYVIGFPFLIAGLAIAVALSVLVLLYQFFKLIPLFFTGRSLSSDLDEDIKAKEILSKMNPSFDTPKTDDSLSLYPNDAPVYGAQYSSPVEEKKEEESALENEEENHD